MSYADITGSASTSHSDVIPHVLTAMRPTERRVHGTSMVSAGVVKSEGGNFMDEASHNAFFEKLGKKLLSGQVRSGQVG